MVTCRSIQYVAQPFRVKPGDKGTFRGSIFEVARNGCYNVAMVHHSIHSVLEVD